MKLRRIITLALALSIASATPAYAKIDDIGFFGGVSQGTRLPKTTEILLAGQSRAARQGAGLPWKEVIFVNGTPRVFEGILTVTSGGEPAADEQMGTYDQTYEIEPSIATDPAAVLTRSITFTVNWRREGKQIIKDYAVDAANSSWEETLTLDGVAISVDNRLSSFSASILEDAAPGCTYYKGNVSSRTVYMNEEATAPYATVDVSGSFYGYSNPWSSTDVQRLDGYVYNNAGWQMQYQIRPSVSVSKQISYSQNEPSLISFAGNYQEIMQNLSGASYNVYARPVQFYQDPESGNINMNNTGVETEAYYESPGGDDISLASYNTFEQLIAPDLTFLKGHPAEGDISKLFAMQILDGDPKFYQPSQAITRDQFVTALTKAIKLPIEPVQTTGRGGRGTVQTILFPDVPQDRPSYPYIMAAYKAGLAVGRSDGMFYSDSSIQRQEAIAILLRAMGLQQLGLDPTPITPFSDDAEIADWAKREIYAAHRIGLIFPDDSGRIDPQGILSKAEAAALINRMIDYMRADIADDYSAHIVNFPD